MKRKEKGIEGRKTWRGFKDENKDGMKGSKKGYKDVYKRKIGTRMKWGSPPPVRSPTSPTYPTLKS